MARLWDEFASLSPSGAARYNISGAQFAVPEFGIYGMTGWIPTVMMQGGETFVPALDLAALVLGMNFAGTLTCGYLVDHFDSGRGP